MATDNTIPVGIDTGAAFRNKRGPIREQAADTSLGPRVEREFTYGEKAVGLDFNPSGDPDVQRVKELHAEIIDILDRKRKTVENPSEKGAILTWGIRESQAAQMVAVKGLTYRD